MSRFSSGVPDAMYRDDLAHIHVDGYGFHWERASAAVLLWLQKAGVTSGRVVDLGCGGGQWLARLAENGYLPHGVDASESMIALARRAAPAAELQCASFAEAPLPECDAVTSLGEPLNYLNSRRLFRRTLHSVAKRLRSGGVFIFDVRIPPPKALGPHDHVREGDGWFCHSRNERSRNGEQLERRITTFRRQKDGSFRRACEVHRLRLISGDEIAQWLRKLNFSVQRRRAYGEYRLNNDQLIFIARKL
ncbi:MAG: class I SAM-dependent methyltransferase [Planctomycetales bacterium]|nr:class I SAM-dependent methyltransferase [Planctomycetales bacterium]